MLCFKRKTHTHAVNIYEDEKKFKNINETYLSTFLLALGFMFPNPRYDGRRKKIVVGIIVSVLPILITILYDMRLRILHNDRPNFMRQTIIFVSIAFVITKLLSTVYRGKELRGVIDDINDDYEKYNNLPKDYQKIIVQSIKKAKILEKVWLIVMTLTALTYPVIAILCTLYSIFYTENPNRFMMHEITVLFLTDEQKYETPYYELFTLYSTYFLWVVYLGFTGFDGMFTICTSHVSLKLHLCSQDLKLLFVDTTDVTEIKRRIAQFVKDHCEIIRLVGEIQKCFEVWLVGVFFNAVLQIGMALIQITNNEESGINGTYYFFVLATIVHMYLPCFLASDITSTAAEIANMAYCCSWESINDKDIRMSIAFIMAKAQIPINFKAFGILTFNMEMFASILQTTYSMYTLLRN